MGLNSYKKSILMGIISGATTICLCILYMYIIKHLTGGRPFVTKAETYNRINGISLTAVTHIGIFISSLVPVILLRYNYNYSYPTLIITYFAISSVTYFLLMLLTDIIITTLRNLTDNYYIGPTDSVFDLINYVVCIFPLGSMIGSILSLIINTVKNKIAKSKNIRQTPDV